MASVVINEIQSSNGSTVFDEDEDASDWIELVNTGSEPVDLEGWGLSDRENQPFMWVFPSHVLAPGGRLLVWASGKDRLADNGIDEPGHLPAAAPDEIPGLVLWLNAEAEDFPDEGGVETWTDRSGRGNHAIAPAAANAPVFRSDRLNGKPALTFDHASDTYLVLPGADFAGMSDLSDFTVMTVAKWQGTTQSGLFGAWPHPTGNNVHFEFSSTARLRLRTGGSNISAASTATIDRWEVYGGSMSNASDSPVSRLFVKGDQVASGTSASGSTLLADYGAVTVGNSNPGRAFDGEIAEFVIYNRALTTDERVKLANHLVARYDLADASNPPSADLPGFHTNFSISAEGETIILSRADGSVADLVPAIAIPRDASYGRSPDGTGEFVFFADPTPASANTSTGYGPPAERPEFSHPRGLYDSTFQLVLSHADPAVTIHYTTDGSEPGSGAGSVYAGPIEIPTTRIVRAVAEKPGALPVREVETHSYLFLDHAAQVTVRPAGLPASWGGRPASYGMSSFVASQPGYAVKMREALEALPILSISTSDNDLFGGGGAGVYINSNNVGYEKEVSAEWIGLEDVGNFQINAGLRVQGEASRSFNNTPKKSLRLLFKSQYGEGRLRQPVLADGGGTLADDFNTIHLRADYNNSWLHWGADQRLRGSMLRDQWMRDTQIAASGTGSSGNHVHLFLNGRYWGIYNPSERIDAAFAATHLGGEREEYDAIRHGAASSGVRIRDGDNIAWEQMRSIVLSGLSSPENYQALQQYLDMDHFIDYMIVNIFGANLDWPSKNWNTVRKREPGAGFHFYVWDAERSMENVATNRVSISGNEDPAEIYAALRQNAEFRLRFADRVHRHFFNGGALTPERNSERYATRAARIRTGIFAEAARWGAYRNEEYDRGGPSPRYALEPHWDAERDRLLNDYFPFRSAIVVSQFQSGNLYPGVAAPVFSQHGGEIAEGGEITMSAAAGTIYHTTDGSDPRVEGSGAVAPGATAYSGPVALLDSAVLKARVFHNGTWSALNQAAFQVLLDEPSFIPEGSGDWAANANWTGGVFPDGAAKKAFIPAPAAGDRNVNIRTPVTVGGIRFDEGMSAFRNRVRDQGEGNTLTFDGGPGDSAKIRVAGGGSGFVEFEVAAGTILASDLELEINHLAGDGDHGPLRLRSDWSGPGGIIKTGPGIASFTGENKNFTGAVEVREGVLRLTEPSTPSFAAAVSVEPGGQLRLVSGGTRTYGFGSPITIAGYGRGEEIPDGEGEGKLGALRYQPGSGQNLAVIPQPVLFAAPASIHVNGSGNTLVLAEPLSGSHPLVKSGGGSLRLLADSPAFDGGFALDNGRLELAGGFASAVTIAEAAVLSGHGATGTISGEGEVRLGHGSIHAPFATGVVVSARFGSAGAPQWDLPASSGNGFLRLSSAPAGLAAMRVYVTGDGDSFQGLLFVPDAEDLAAVLAETPVEFFAPDPGGTHSFEGESWSAIADARIFAVAAVADFGDGPVAGKTLEIRLVDPAPSFESWLDLAFPDPADRSDPAIAGPAADPFGTGLANLLRYALGFDPALPNAGTRPLLVGAQDDLRFRFPFNPGLADVAYLVEGTTDLADWNDAVIHFDSRTDPASGLADGLLEVALPTDAERMFFRLRVIQQ